MNWFRKTKRDGPTLQPGESMDFAVPQKIRLLLSEAAREGCVIEYSQGPIREYGGGALAREITISVDGLAIGALEITWTGGGELSI